MRSSVAVAVVAVGVVACQGGRPARTGAPHDAATGSGALPPVADAATAMPIADCPVPHVAEGTPLGEEVDALLEAAHAALDAGRFAEAWTCADRAADLEPDAVEAHHLRAASFAALGRYDDAELAYMLALAIDPTDAETMRGLADFEISVRPDPSRDALRLGAELAGRAREAIVRSRPDSKLETELYVLEAQAQNDLGRADLALALAEKALARTPGNPDALYERAAGLLDLLRFADAEVAFRAVLEVTPDDAFAHDGLGLALEWLGKPADAEAEHARARTLAPESFAPPVIVSVAELQAEVDATLAELSPARRARVATVSIQIVDQPELEDLQSVSPPFPPTILGLFRGAPDGEDDPTAPPRAILLYRINLGRAVRTAAELRDQVRTTLLHEIGHFEGQDEDDLRRHGLE